MPIKKDKKNLKIDELIFTNQDGSERKIKGVLQTKEPFTFYSEKIEKIIKDKSEKLQAYNDLVTHTNLIIHDKENYISEIEMKNFYPTLFNETITKSILESGFNEIFLITSVSSDLYYFPLKSIFLAEKFKLFIVFLREKEVDFFSDIRENFIKFCKYLSLSRAKQIIAFENENFYGLAYGNVLLQINLTGSIVYRLIPLKDINLSEVIQPFFNNQIDYDFCKEFNQYGRDFFTIDANYGFKITSSE